MRINCSSTCKSLCLPLSLACMKCKPALEKIQLGGKPRTKFQNCQKWWQSHFKGHREHRIIEQHSELMAFLEGKKKDDGTTKDDDTMSIASISSSSLQVQEAQAISPMKGCDQGQKEETQIDPVLFLSRSLPGSGFAMESARRLPAILEPIRSQARPLPSCRSP